MGTVGKVAVIATATFVWATATALGAVTPGWECVPTAAGSAVISGGTGSAPSCGAGTTSVLAPTYVSSGVGGKPTAEFASVNVQIVSGSGSTSGAVNGKGNLIVGYAEQTSGFAQTGSNDLVVGSDNGWTSYGEIVGGNRNQALGSYATAVGQANKASGSASFAAGQGNTASGGRASVTGGLSNVARGTASSVLGGDLNLASDSFASVVSGCDNLAGTGSRRPGDCTGTGSEGVLGGFENTASGAEATVSGGQSNTASGSESSVLGGKSNTASAICQAIPAAPGSC